MKGPGHDRGVKGEARSGHRPKIEECVEGWLYRITIGEAWEKMQSDEGVDMDSCFTCGVYPACCCTVSRLKVPGFEASGVQYFNIGLHIRGAHGVDVNGPMPVKRQKRWLGIGWGDTHATVKAQGRTEEA